MSHELPWGTAQVAEADLATYVKELEKRPQRQQALITRMLAEAGDGKGRSLARLLLLQDTKVGTRRHRHTGEKRVVPLKDSARERYKRASEIWSGRSWDPDQQYFYLPVGAVSAPKGLLRTPDPRPSKGGPASGQRAAFDLLVGSAVDTAEPTDSQMVVVVLLEELVVGAFRHAASLSVADVHAKIVAALPAIKSITSAPEVVLLATCSSKMLAHLGFSDRWKLGDLPALAEAIREGGEVDKADVVADVTAQAALAQAFLCRVRDHELELHTGGGTLYLDFGASTVARLRGSDVDCGIAGVPQSPCSLINAVAWAFGGSYMHRCLVISSDMAMLSWLLLAFEREEVDLGQLSRSVKLHLPQADGRVVDVQAEYQRLEAGGAGRAVAAAAAIWAGGQLSGCLAVLPINFGTPTAVVQHALVQHASCALRACAAPSC
jgi:hypothetical protein